MSRLRPILIVLIFIGICAIAIILAGTALTIPQRAEARFGPPSPNLNPLQRFRLSLALLLDAEILTTPANLAGSEQPFTIEAGNPADTVIRQLFRAGLIADPDSFRSYLIYAGIDTRLQAGNYTLSPAMTPIEVAQSIR
ncbi:MAG: hypothetical protein ACE5GO_04575, partial [Anaerolineales bacterium]